MSNTLKIVERVRERTETGTDYAVAIALGIHPSNFRRVMAGTGWLGPKAIRKAAEMLDIDPGAVEALVMEDKAKTQAEKAYWGSLCSTRIREALDAATETSTALMAIAAPALLAIAILSEFLGKNIHYAYLM